MSLNKRLLLALFVFFMVVFSVFSHAEIWSYNYPTCHDNDTCSSLCPESNPDDITYSFSNSSITEKGVKCTYSKIETPSNDIKSLFISMVVGYGSCTDDNTCVSVCGAYYPYDSTYKFFDWGFKYSSTDPTVGNVKVEGITCNYRSTIAGDTSYSYFNSLDIEFVRMSEDCSVTDGIVSCAKAVCNNFTDCYVEAMNSCKGIISNFSFMNSNNWTYDCKEDKKEKSGDLPDYCYDEYVDPTTHDLTVCDVDTGTDVDTGIDTDTHDSGITGDPDSSTHASGTGIDRSGTGTHDSGWVKVGDDDDSSGSGSGSSSSGGSGSGSSSSSGSGSGSSSSGSSSSGSSSSGGSGSGSSSSGELLNTLTKSGSYGVVPASEKFENLFDADSIASYKTKIVALRKAINSSSESFKSTLLSKLTITARSSGYEANDLKLGKWGSYNISLSRFSQYFPQLGQIVYFICAMYAFFIVLEGLRFG